MLSLLQVLYGEARLSYWLSDHSSKAATAVRVWLLLVPWHRLLTRFHHNLFRSRRLVDGRRLHRPGLRLAPPRAIGWSARAECRMANRAAGLGHDATDNLELTDRGAPVGQ